MARSRRNRGGPAHRRDPLAKPPRPPADPELAALREAAVLPAIKDLRAADPRSRSAAASAVSNIVHDSRCRKLLLREHIVHTLLTQTLTDAALESRAAGWGILQVLAEEEAADFCVHLARQDILTAIEHAARPISQQLLRKPPADPAPSKAEQAFLSTIAASLVSLLTALAEAADDILEAVAANHALVQLLFHLVAHSGQADSDALASLRTDALACLMILCEDNAQLATTIVASEGAQCLQAMMALKDEANSDGVLACAVLHNIFAALDGADDAPRVPNADDSLLIPTLTKVLSAVAPAQTAPANGHGWSNPVEQQQLALETLASIGSSLASAVDGPGPQKHESAEAKDDQVMGDADEPGSDGEEEGGQGEDDDDMDQDEMQDDMDMVAGDGGGGGGGGSIDDSPVLNALIQTALPEIIRVACLHPGGHQGISLRNHALSALNNVAWSLAVIDYSDDQNVGVQKAWTPAGQSIWERVISPTLSADTADIHLATNVTSIAWAVSRSLGPKTPLKPAEHRKFISLYQATKGLESRAPGDPLQSLGVRCVGVLGQLALHPAPVDVNREIGTFLVTLVASLPETPAADAVQALGHLFDLYGDEALPCDKEVFWKDNFLAHLEHALPKVRALARTIDKKTHAELRAEADAAVLNLTRFLAYKRKHRP